MDSTNNSVRETITLNVILRDKTRKTGEPFIQYLVRRDGTNDKFKQARFGEKTCELKPKERCKIVIFADNYFVDTRNKKYPVLHIKQVERIIKYTPEELEQIDREIAERQYLEKARFWDSAKRED